MSTHSHKAAHSVAKHTNGTTSGTKNVLSRAEHFAEQATEVLGELPKTFRDEIKTHPYRAIGVAAAVGVGAGVILNSRILRGTVASLASVVVAELARSYLKSAVGKEFGAISFDRKSKTGDEKAS